jgi:hypothetical protein
MFRIAKPVSVAAILAASLLCSTPALAQVLTVGSGEARRGQTIDLPVHFAADGVVVGFELNVVYDPTRFGPPTCFARNGAACAVHHGEGRIAMLALEWSLAPMPSNEYATLRFPVLPESPRGVALLGVRGAEMVNSVGNRVVGTIHSGQINIR